MNRARRAAELARRRRTAAHPRAATYPRTAALGAVLSVLVAVVAAVVNGVGAASPAVAAAPAATVAISTLDPAVGGTGGRLHVAGTVTVGTRRLSDIQVALRLSRTRVNSRSELAGVAAGETTGKDGDVIARQSVGGPLPAGGSTRFDLGADLDLLPQLREFGVYVVGVQVTATDRDGNGPVAITRTFLPWVPAKRGFTPTGFAWLWPLVDQPSLVSDGTLANDSLADSLNPGGRVARLTTAGARLGQATPLTWAIDPDLLETAATMTGGYTVRGAGDGTKGSGGPLAADWLTQLRAATGASEVLAMPYADPDLVALRRRGLSAGIETARDVGTQVATKVLGRDVTSDVSWPIDGYVDRATLGVLRRRGVNTVVLDGRAQPPRLQLNYTPSGRADVAAGGGSMTSLVADPVLTDQLAHTGGSPLLAAQRFLAETAMITAEMPNASDGRVILVAPPRRWDPPQEFLDRLVSGVSSATWMSGDTLSDMRAAPAAEVERRGVRYPNAARTSELPRPYLTALRSQGKTIDLWDGVLADRANRARIIPALDKGLMRLGSSWWRDRGDRVNRHNIEQTHVADLVNGVHVQPGAYTFGSRSGEIPLTIANETDYGVRVVLRLDSDQRLRLQPVGPVPIGPNSKVQVQVQASAIASGTASVTATLRTLRGADLNQPVALRIRITQFGTVALIITMGAGGVLVLAALLRLARRARAARRSGGRREPPGADAPDQLPDPQHAGPTP